mmetsp:Transcript_140115/g.254797  ORF Transcript_140115/g.254797 Transcript_140115/m.254797 type:complete len:547 (+) Transcript_140115:226-1866(+)
MASSKASMPSESWGKSTAVATKALPPKAKSLPTALGASSPGILSKAGPTMPLGSPLSALPDDSLSRSLDMSTLPASLALTSPSATPDTGAVTMISPGPLTGSLGGIGGPLGSPVSAPTSGSTGGSLGSSLSGPLMEPLTMPAIAPAVLAEAAPQAPGPGPEPPPLLGLNGGGLLSGTLVASLVGTMPAQMLEQVEGNGQLASTEPQAKRLRLARWGGDEQPENVPPALAAALAPVPPLAYQAEDTSWQEPWAEVFMKLQESDLEGRAGEYAEALVALRKQAETLRRQQETVKYSCEQLWQTAQREALLAHLKSMTESAEVGVPKEVIEAARRAADEPVPPEPPGPPPGLPGLDPGLLAKLDPALVAKLAETKAPFSGWDANSQTPNAEPKAPSKPRKSGWDMGPAAGSEPAVPPIPPDVLMGAEAMKFVNSLENTSHANLYVSGLPDNIDEASFRLLFARHGIIISTKVMPDRRYGFVKFSRPVEAHRAIEALNGFSFNGLQLSVRYADRDRGQPNPANKGAIMRPPPVIPQVKLPPFASGGGTAL